LTCGEDTSTCNGNGETCTSGTDCCTGLICGFGYCVLPDGN
jgi:hypothetical protein